MWVSAILSKKDNDDISKICLDNNTDIKLSDRFFRFPLHISLKRTFYTDDYLTIKNDLKKLINQSNPIIIQDLKLMRNKDMLWLDFDNKDAIISLHQKIDELLFQKYKIPIDEYDKNYYPHITIFRDDDIDKLEMMFNRIEELINKEEIIIDTFALGTSLENNEFYKKEN